MKWKELYGFIVPEQSTEFSVYKDFPNEKEKIERKIKLRDHTIIVTSKGIYSDQTITDGKK